MEKGGMHPAAGEEDLYRKRHVAKHLHVSWLSGLVDGQDGGDRHVARCTLPCSERVYASWCDAGLVHYHIRSRMGV